MIAAGGSAKSRLDVFVLSLGGFLVAGAANGMNQVLEKDFDKLMDRTMNRPLPQGRMQPSVAIMISGIMAVLGLLMLSWFNPLTTLLGALAFVSYAFIYTPLKRYSCLSVLVGAIPGALPALIGGTAFSGSITSIIVFLFLIQFIWQFPHFWSIGWISFGQYKNAGYKLLPVESDEPTAQIGWYSFIYSLVLIPLVGLAWMVHFTHMITLGIVIFISIQFTWKSWILYKTNDKIAARGVMFSSFAYLPIVFGAFLIDKILF
jgi:protoheme IX farnesyltransferase